MTKKVFAVTSGSYSDYHVVAVFSTEAKAQEYIDASKEAASYDWCNLEDVEEYTLDAPIIPLYYVTVRMLRDGTIEDGDNLDLHFGEHTTGFVGIWIYNSGDSAFSWTTDTKDKKRAIKVANEKRAEIIALGLWPTGDEDRKALQELNKQIKERVH
jgi:hypothetical protein